MAATIIEGDYNVPARVAGRDGRIGNAANHLITAVAPNNSGANI